MLTGRLVFMNEAIRMHYLEAMGVDMFVPRKRLVNAPEATLCRLPQKCVSDIAGAGASAIMHPAVAKSGPALGRSKSEHSSPEENLSINPNSSLSSVLADIGAVVDAESDNQGRGLKEAPQASEVSASVAEVKDFSVVGDSKGDASAHSKLASSIATITSPEINQAVELQPANLYLGLWHTANGILVLDEMAPGDALPTDALLGNILSANGLLPAGLPSLEVQRWPVPGAVGGDPTWAGACEMMRDFLDGRSVSAPIRALILCGESAAKAVFGEDFDHSSSCFSEQNVPGFEYSGLVLPSLKTMLYQPELKKNIWRALLPHRA